MPRIDIAARVDSVRSFNRFYTQRIGILAGAYQESPFSLTEARVLYEIVHGDSPPASTIARELGLDDGYLSRILRGFEKDGLIRREASLDDGRQSLLSPTAKGKQKFAALEAATRSNIGAMLRKLQDADQQRVVAAMETIVDTLSDGPVAVDSAFVLRSPLPGDFGWIVARHGLLYAQEYGWTGAAFESLCAKIVADFAGNNDPKRERCFIAERGGEKMGSVMLVKDSAQVARIRLLLVEPSARGLGIGEKLTQECLAFARAANYRKVTLWTHSILTGARRIYQRAGFKLIKSKKHNDWGTPLVGETWELTL
jgi:DNA-binding MarR family transcriptional regulator/GNAT superfamily N-acetyltransferase